MISNIISIVRFPCISTTNCLILKFIYPEKATKFLTTVYTVKSKDFAKFCGLLRMYKLYLASLYLHYIPQWDQFTCMISTSKNMETTQPYSLLGAPIIAWFYTYTVCTLKADFTWTLPWELRSKLKTTQLNLLQGDLIIAKFSLHSGCLLWKQILTQIVPENWDQRSCKLPKLIYCKVIPLLPDFLC